MIKGKLALQYVSVRDLNPNVKNPRTHTNKQIRQIAESIRTFGFNVPLIIDRDLRVIAGHGRLLACQRLGLTEVPAIRIDHLSEEQIVAFTIADNRLTENAEWDEKLLGEQLQILSNVDLDFSVEITGFETSEIDLFIDNLTSDSGDGTDPADILPDPNGGSVVTRHSDCWILGSHRLVCGDATNSRSFSQLMNGRRAQMIFTDPPYNDPIDGYVTGFGKIHHPEFIAGSGEMSSGEFQSFLKSTITNLVQHSAAGSLHFICMDWRHSRELLAASRARYSELKNICVWVKENAGQGSLYRSQHELVFVFKAGKKSHRNNVQLGKSGRYRTNVWNYRRVNSLTRNSDESCLPGMHPTIKPVELVADAILDCTRRKEVVLDPFLGSGTTLIAAERTGRVCFGMELDPRYVDVIVRRWQTYTGLVAIHEQTGRSFSEIAGDRDEKTS